MHKIVCLLDILDCLKYKVDLFLSLNLDFLLLDVGSVLFDIVFGYLSHGLN